MLVFNLSARSLAPVRNARRVNYKRQLEDDVPLTTDSTGTSDTAFESGGLAEPTAKRVSSESTNERETHCSCQKCAAEAKLQQSLKHVADADPRDAELHTFVLPALLNAVIRDDTGSVQVRQGGKVAWTWT